MRYVIRTDQPFMGNAQSFLTPEGTVAYTDGLTPEQYAAERNFPIRIVSADEMDALTTDFTSRLKSSPVEESEDAYDDALNALPPSRWKRIRGVEMFHMCELITHDLAQWHAKLGERYFTFIDSAGADMEVLAANVAAAAKAN